MDIEKIKHIVDLVTASNIAELELHENQESLRVQLNKSAPLVSVVPSPAPNMVLNQAPTTTAALSPTTSSSAKHTVTSPMVGSVYLSATPGTKPFVEVGQTVKSGDTLCLIEAMKMFNRIEADQAGVIAAILIENAQAVEYNQPLFTIE